MKYFSDSCSGPSGEHGWYVDENTANLKYVVNMTGAVPPKIEILQIGLNSLDPLPQYIPPYSFLASFVESKINRVPIPITFW